MLTSCLFEDRGIIYISLHVIVILADYGMNIRLYEKDYVDRATLETRILSKAVKGEL